MRCNDSFCFGRTLHSLALCKSLGNCEVKNDWSGDGADKKFQCLLAWLFMQKGWHWSPKYPLGQ